MALFNLYNLEATKAGAMARNKARWPAIGAAGTRDARMTSLSPISDMLAKRLPLVDAAINKLPER